MVAHLVSRKVISTMLEPGQGVREVNNYIAVLSTMSSTEYWGSQVEEGGRHCPPEPEEERVGV